jgi:hypothetical protein
VRRRVLAVAGLAVLAGACGGGSSSPTAPTPDPTPIPTPITSAVVVLDSANFEARVLGATKPVLVEFQLPT